MPKVNTYKTRTFEKPGWVYALQSSDYPGVLKIGMTTKTPEVRMREINAGTGVITPFVMAHKEKTESARRSEQAVHDELAEFRISMGKEFFRVSVEHATESISRICVAISAEVSTATIHTKKNEYIRGSKFITEVIRTRGDEQEVTVTERPIYVSEDTKSFQAAKFFTSNIVCGRKHSNGLTFNPDCMRCYMRFDSWLRSYEKDQEILNGDM